MHLLVSSEKFLKIKTSLSYFKRHQVNVKSSDVQAVLLAIKNVNSLSKAQKRRAELNISLNIKSAFDQATTTSV